MRIVKVEGSVRCPGGWCGVLGTLGGLRGLCRVLVLVRLGWLVGRMDVMARDIGEGGPAVVRLLSTTACACAARRS